jgi:hypothetical protein
MNMIPKLAILTMILHPEPSLKTCRKIGLVPSVVHRVYHAVEPQRERESTSSSTGTQEDTKDRILDAVSRGFRSRGYNGIGVDALAKMAGVTSGHSGGAHGWGDLSTIGGRRVGGEPLAIDTAGKSKMGSTNRQRANCHQ